LATLKNSRAFDPALMSADLAAIGSIIHDWFRQVKEDDWKRTTEARPKGWTLIQAFCHVAAVSELMIDAVEVVLDDSNPRDTALIKSRKELAAFNEKQIALRQDLPPELLLQTFLESLTKADSLVEGFSAADFEKPVPLNVYNRPQTIAELIGNQLSHPVVVHGAQLAKCIGLEPLWRQFSAELMQRQLTRFFHVLSHSYWPERGGDLSAVINFNIRGEGGGHWHVRLGEDGGAASEGLVEQPSLTLHFANPDAFCSLFTIQLSPIQGVLKGKVFPWGNIPLAFKLSHLFTPT
jgi:hypothetical protein